jgi:hypothetical protein
VLGDPNRRIPSPLARRGSALGSLLVPLLTVPNAQVISDEIIAIQISTALVMSIGFAYVARASAQLYLGNTDRSVANPT